MYGKGGKGKKMKESFNIQSNLQLVNFLSTELIVDEKKSKRSN